MNLPTFRHQSPTSTATGQSNSLSGTTNMRNSSTRSDEIFQPYTENVPDNVPSSETTESLIAQQLSKLSCKDREVVFDDIHGTSRTIAEDPSFLDGKLKDLEMEMQENSSNEDRTDYDLEYQANPLYVENRDFRLAFLRADRFDARSTAARIFRYSQLKRALFGPELYGRDVMQDDLTEEELDGLYSGYLQQLPIRDNSGRAIWVSFHTPEHHSMNAWKKLRWNFYLYFKAVICNTDTQRSGSVLIMYNLFPMKSKNSEKLDAMSEETTSESKKYIHNLVKLPSSLPGRCEAMHFCYNTAFWKPLITFAKWTCDIFTKLRFRTVHGSIQECHYYLMSFGIPTYSIPIRLNVSKDETLRSDVHVFEDSDHPNNVILTDTHKTQMMNWRTQERRQQLLQDQMKQKQQKEMSIRQQATHVGIPQTWHIGDEKVTAGKTMVAALFPSSESFIVVPRPQDVLFGRGKAGNHVGNVQFRKLVLERMDTYNCASKYQKAFIIDEVIEIVHSTFRGRFLKQAKGSSGWTEVKVNLSKQRQDLKKILDPKSDITAAQQSSKNTTASSSSNEMKKALPVKESNDEIREKVASAFRSLRKKQLQKQKKNIDHAIGRESTNSRLGGYNVGRVATHGTAQGDRMWINGTAAVHCTNPIDFCNHCDKANSL